MAKRRDNFVLGEQSIAPGTRVMVSLPLPKLYTNTDVTMPVHVVHGRREGPVLFVSAAIHGDELNGVEIVHRLLALRALTRLRGTLLAIPAVNAYGVVHQSRYLPDGRDLNRSFPGRETGSLASRVAHVFMTEIVQRCTHGIDLHTGALHRANLPQIRGNLDDSQTERLALAFGVPVVLDASLRDGSLREAAAERDMPMLLYEAGEALRLDEFSLRAGVRGIVNVLRQIGMLAATAPRRQSRREPWIARSSGWVRAGQSGILKRVITLGATVEKGDTVGAIAELLTGAETRIASPASGVVIGRSNLPLVHEGDPVIHIARFRRDLEEIADHLEEFQLEHARGDDGSRLPWTGASEGSPVARTSAQEGRERIEVQAPRPL